MSNDESLSLVESAIGDVESELGKLDEFTELAGTSPFERVFADRSSVEPNFCVRSF
jgi:hypothetical protein